MEIGDNFKLFFSWKVALNDSTSTPTNYGPNCQQPRTSTHHWRYSFEFGFQKYQILPICQQNIWRNFSQSNFLAQKIQIDYQKPRTSLTSANQWGCEYVEHACTEAFKTGTVLCTLKHEAIMFKQNLIFFNQIKIETT